MTVESRLRPAMEPPVYPMDTLTIDFRCTFAPPPRLENT
eukprot:CAMPEP_0173325286 /NCGR_PEP_ID=MMETSP1144-20121109/423_1 /TAXON_ID=483371 /ORGANISM="non described non described, Strain CCMP2298" /LENGTH=38 /DNA_ID= /DNA_START= /DNA_END= /DNA_ORIENTATION=